MKRLWAIIALIVITVAGGAGTLLSPRQIAPSGSGTAQVLTSSGTSVTWAAPTGDMLKSVYDTNANGIPDNAEALGGQALAAFPRLAISNTFTGANQFALGLNLRNALGNYSNTFSAALGSEWSNGTATYANGSNSITVSGGVATNSAGAGSSDAFAYLNTAAAIDGTVQGDLTVGGALMMRHNGAGSGYQLLFYSGSSVLFIRQTSGQSDVQLYQSATGQAAGTYKVVMVGNTFAIYQGTTLMTTITDSTYPSGYVGIYAQNTTGNSIDNFVWTPAAPPTGYTGLAFESGVLKVRNTAGQVVSVGQQESVRTITAATTLTSSDDTLNFNTTAGAFTQPLPSAVGLTGKNFFLKKIDASTNALTISTTSSQTIDGQSAYVLNTQYAGVEFTSDGANWSITALALPGSRVDIYGSASTSGTFTWTKPSWAKSVTVTVIGSGGGGGSGRKGAAATARGGGSGGGGGAISTSTFPASILGATETVTVGAGGTGGAAVTASSTSGNSGAVGNVSSFGSWIRIAGTPGGGSGGTAAAGSASAGGAAMFSGGNSGAASITAGGGNGSAAIVGAGGGGAGGSLTTGDVLFNGGLGATAALSQAGNTTVGTAGTSSTVAGGAGGSLTSGVPFGGGGGGGGYPSNTSTAPGAGGAGGWPGGGGGGGGAALDTTTPNSGAGGAGGNGAVYVYSVP